MLDLYETILLLLITQLSVCFIYILHELFGCVAIIKTAPPFWDNDIRSRFLVIDSFPFVWGRLFLDWDTFWLTSMLFLTASKIFQPYGGFWLVSIFLPEIRSSSVWSSHLSVSPSSRATIIAKNWPDRDSNQGTLPSQSATIPLHYWPVQWNSRQTLKAFFPLVLLNGRQCIIMFRHYAFIRAKLYSINSNRQWLTHRNILSHKWATAIFKNWPYI